MSVTTSFPVQAVIAFVGVLVVAGLLAWSVKQDPRSLRNGFLVIVLLHYVLGFLVFVVSSTRALETAAEVVSLIVRCVIGLGLLLLPLLLIADGVLMLRPRLARRAPARAIVVLGAGLVNGAVSPLLAARLRSALGAADARARPGERLLLVPSGGRGGDEPVAEAHAMAEWLRQHGGDPQDILIEDRARTTRENLRYSVELLQQNGREGPYLIVTNDYHAPRAAMLARRLGIDAQAIGAPTARYFWPSAYLREFVAVLLEHRWLLASAGVLVVGMSVLVGCSLRVGAALPG